MRVPYHNSLQVILGQDVVRVNPPQQRLRASNSVEKTYFDVPAPMIFLEVAFDAGNITGFARGAGLQIIQRMI